MEALVDADRLRHDLRGHARRPARGAHAAALGTGDGELRFHLARGNALTPHLAGTDGAGAGQWAGRLCLAPLVR